MAVSETSSRVEINPFVSNLSMINFLFAFSMNIFNYTILYLLSVINVPIVYGGIGISIGQALIIFVVVPQGRLIDKGKSYFLMIAGSSIYAITFMVLFLESFYSSVLIFYLTSAIIAVMIISQNMYKSSLSSFIGKAIKSSLMGKNYSRILWMETAGGTVAFFLLAITVKVFDIDYVYFFSGFFLLLVVISSFFFLFKEERTHLITEESKVKRPTFMESIRSLSDKRRFLIPIFMTKIFMSIGIFGYSYFYIILGEQIGINGQETLLFLGLSFAVGVLWGIYSERFVDRHPGRGKSYIIIMAFIDLLTYILILYAVMTGNILLFLFSSFIGSPGPLVVAGALSYELKVVGKENRGMFGGIQRTLVAIPAILMGAPLTYLFHVNYLWMWLVIVFSSLISFISSLLIPSREYLKKKHNLEEL